MSALIAEIRILRGDGSPAAVVDVHADGTKIVNGNLGAADLLLPLIIAALRKEGA